MSKLLLTLLISASVSGCGTFQLSGGTSQAGKTADQHQLDVLTCQHEGKMAASTGARQTGAFLLGLTIIGTPVAFELDKAKQREVFAQCMTARGYTVAPLAGQKQAAADYRSRQ